MIPIQVLEFWFFFDVRNNDIHGKHVVLCETGITHCTTAAQGAQERATPMQCQTVKK